jgi:hypothetical protein
LQIVFYPPTCPNFLRFLALHKRSVEVTKTHMTFSVSRDSGAFEWANHGLRSVFCQPRRVFDLGMWRMLFDIMRFNACAVRVLAENEDLSIREYLQKRGYSSRFTDDYLIVCLCPRLFFSSLIALCIVAHDGRSVESRCMHPRLPSETLDPIPTRSPPVANHRKAFMVYHQRWQVGGGVEEHVVVLSFITVKRTLNQFCPSCPPRSYTSQRVCTRYGREKGI